MASTTSSSPPLLFTRHIGLTPIISYSAPANHDQTGHASQTFPLLEFHGLGPDPTARPLPRGPFRITCSDPSLSLSTNSPQTAGKLTLAGQPPQLPAAKLDEVVKCAGKILSVETLTAADSHPSSGDVTIDDPTTSKTLNAVPMGQDWFINPSRPKDSTAVSYELVCRNRRTTDGRNYRLALIDVPFMLPNQATVDAVLAVATPVSSPSTSEFCIVDALPLLEHNKSQGQGASPSGMFMIYNPQRELFIGGGGLGIPLQVMARDQLISSIYPVVAANMVSPIDLTAYFWCFRWIDNPIGDGVYRLLPHSFPSTIPIGMQANTDPQSRKYDFFSNSSYNPGTDELALGNLVPVSSDWMQCFTLSKTALGGDIVYFNPLATVFPAHWWDKPSTVPLVSDVLSRWRVISVLSATARQRWIIYEDAAQQFLAHRSLGGGKMTSYLQSSAKGDGAGLDGIVAMLSQEDLLSAILNEELEKELESRYGDLLWTISPAYRGPMAISKNNVASEKKLLNYDKAAGFVQTVANSNPASAEEWWTMTSNVTTEGQVYYEMQNYKTSRYIGQKVLGASVWPRYGTSCIFSSDSSSTTPAATAVMETRWFVDVNLGTNLTYRLYSFDQGSTLMRSGLAASSLQLQPKSNLSQTFTDSQGGRQPSWLQGVFSLSPIVEDLSGPINTWMTTFGDQDLQVMHVSTNTVLRSSVNPGDLSTRLVITQAAKLSPKNDLVTEEKWKFARYRKLRWDSADEARFYENAFSIQLRFDPPLVQPGFQKPVWILSHGDTSNQALTLQPKEDDGNVSSTLGVKDLWHPSTSGGPYQKGMFLLSPLGINPPCYLNVDYVISSGSLVLQNDPLGTCWRTLLQSSVSSLSPNSQLAPLQPLPMLDDGVYRIVNKVTNNFLFLDGGSIYKSAVIENDTNFISFSPGNLIMKPSTESTLVLATTELWYVSRCGSYYRIEAYGSPQALDLVETWSTSPPEGRPLTMTPRQPLYQSQAWNIFPVRSGVFVIQDACDSSALEDTGIAEPKSSFLNAARKNQTWVFKAALPLIPTGMYKISFPPTGVVPQSTYLGCWAGPDMSKSTPMTSQWLVTHLPDGLYSLQAIGLPHARWLASRADFADARSYLCISELGLSLSSKWKLFPFGDGTFSLQNLVTSRILIPPSSDKPYSFLYTDYTSDLTNAISQEFYCCANASTLDGFMNVVFETLESTDCYLDVPTDQPVVGRYYISSPQGLRLSVKRVVTPGAGAKPSVSLIDDSVPSDKATASLMLNNSPVWELVSSRNGYYYIVNRKTGGKLASASEIFESKTAESQSPRVLDEFLDCTRWKLFWLDLTMKRFRIVNKATGSMLCNSSNTVTTTSWSSRWGDFTWLLDPVPQTEWIPPWSPTPEFSFLWRDLDVASGEYTIESRGVMSGNCLELNPDILPYQVRLNDMDLHPLSVNSGQQHWIIQKDDEGWYRIRGYLWDLQLTSSENPLQDPTLYLLKPRADNPSKATPNIGAEISIDPSQMQWKFVQASDKVRIISRASLRSGSSNVALSAGRIGDKMSGVLASGFAEETWWNLKLVQGPSTRLKLISGIYSLSVGKQNRSALSQSLSSIVLNSGFIAGPPSSDFQYLVKPRGLPAKIASIATPSSSIDQMMWYFSDGWQPGTFTISAVSDIKSWWLANAGGLIASLPPPGPSDTSYLWKAEPRECYTYILRSVHDPKLVLGAKRDGTGYALSLGNDLETNIWTCKWDFTREGFYIQNNAPSAMCTAMTAVSMTKAVNLTYISLLSSSPNQIWHVSEVFNATPPFVRLFNESLFMTSSATSVLPRAVVQVEGVAGLQPQTDWATVTSQPNQTWKISQFYSPTALPFTANKLDMIVSGNPNVDAQSQLWTFLPVNKVDVGPLTSYPGCVVNIGIADNPQNLDWMKLQVMRLADWMTVKSDPYTLGDPLTRFRLVTYGSLFMMVSDSWTVSVAANSTTVSALGKNSISAAEPICWYTLRPTKSGGKEIVPLVTLIDPTKNPPNLMSVPWQVITNYVDFVDTGTLCRIQAGTSGFLSAGPTQVIGGQVNVKPLDLLDRGQLWRYAEWGTAIKCRSIYHAQTGLTLRANMAFQPIASAPMATSPDLLNALVLNPTTTLKFNTEFLAPGYVWLKPRFAEKDSWDALSVPGLDPATAWGIYDPSRHGFQFIPVSPQSTTLTTKMSILQNFVRNNAPVLLHMPGTVFPANVSVHLTDANVIKDGIGSESAAAFLSRTPRSSDDSKWFIGSPIAFTTPWKGGDPWMPTSSAPTAYVTVRPSTDVAWLNYTDVTYWLLYSTPFRTWDNGEPGFGWASVSMRVNNDNGRVVSVLLNGCTRYANLDSQFSCHLDPADNPLKFLSCASPSPSPSATPFTQTAPSSSTSTSTSKRLHLIVQPLTPTNVTIRRLIITPSSRVHNLNIDTPPIVEANPDLDAKMSDWTAWENMGGKVLDLGSCHRIVEAKMITTKAGKVGASAAVNSQMEQQRLQRQHLRESLLRTGVRIALPPEEVPIAAGPSTESGEMVNGVLIPDENWMRTKVTWLPVTDPQRNIRGLHGPGCEWEQDPFQLARV